ncbi:amidohydrolase family protein [Microlunatus sp. Gsoil 973]|uniref:amidohydrolase family protein n=1 Tax=Microlunatus sp. Gsoil 973 TaxID=2672569 RepID=UPI0012B494D1|nr:amidohydrolase family protein [Microlunatus sp. Gsoil 973]QGN32717.1 amidohydrolase family protein [Microlunatus sp. Gsoil 973]
MYAIRADHAFDGTRFLPSGATVIIDGERIVGVEPARCELPDGIEVAECSGTLLPGLIDCHTHLIADGTFGGLERTATMSDDQLDGVIIGSLRAHAAAGVTTVRDLGDRGYRTLQFRERPGLPRVVAAGPPLTTPGGHCHFLGGQVDGDVARAVAEHGELGVDVIKVMASGGFATPESDQLGAQFSVTELTAIVEAGHALGLPVVAHAHSLIGAQNAISAGVDGIEHFTCLTDSGPRVDDSFLDRVAAQDITVDLTLSNDRALHSAMTLAVLPPAMAKLMEISGFDSFDAFYRTRLDVLARLREHGVRVVAGVDSGMGPIKPHGNVWRSVGEMVGAGYPLSEALASVTSAAADACGLAETTGRLAVGCSADLLVVDQDLAEDLDTLGSAHEVVIRGARLR